MNVEYLDVPNEPGWWHVWELIGNAPQWEYMGTANVYLSPDDDDKKLYMDEWEECTADDDYKYLRIPEPPAPPMEVE